MNKFTDRETQAAHQLYLDANAIVITAKHAAKDYAQEGDTHAATIALLARALELAGGKHFLKPQDENE